MGYKKAMIISIILFSGQQIKAIFQKEIVYHADAGSAPLTVKIDIANGLESFVTTLYAGQTHVFRSLFPCVGHISVKKNAGNGQGFKEFKISDAKKWQFLLCGKVRLIIERTPQGTVRLLGQKDNNQPELISEDAL